MWRINKSNLITLFTRNNLNRLIFAHKLMNPIGSPPFLKFQTPKTEIEYKFANHIQHIHTSFQFDQKQINIGEQNLQDPISVQLKHKIQLREFLFNMKQNIDIPLIISFRDYQSTIPTSIFQKLHHEFEYIIKVIKLKINKSSKMEHFIKEQCYWLLDDLQKKLHNYYQVKMNRIKLKQTCFRLMKINKILTESCNQSNLRNQLHWTLEYGHQSQKSHDIKQAQLCYKEVFQKSVNHKDYRFLAIKYLCRIFQKKRNIDELKKFLEIVKQQKIENHCKLIMDCISRVCDQQSYSGISKQEEESKKKQNKNGQRSPNSFNKMDG